MNICVTRKYGILVWPLRTTSILWRNSYTWRGHLWPQYRSATRISQVSRPFYDGTSTPPGPPLLTHPPWVTPAATSLLVGAWPTSGLRLFFPVQMKCFWLKLGVVKAPFLDLSALFSRKQTPGPAAGAKQRRKPFPICSNFVRVLESHNSAPLTLNHAPRDHY